MGSIMTVKDGRRLALSLKIYLQVPTIFRAGKHILSYHYACIRRLAPCIRRTHKFAICYSLMLAWVLLCTAYMLMGFAYIV